MAVLVVTDIILLVLMVQAVVGQAVIQALAVLAVMVARAVLDLVIAAQTVVAVVQVVILIITQHMQVHLILTVAVVEVALDYWVKEPADLVEPLTLYRNIFLQQIHEAVEAVVEVVVARVVLFQWVLAVGLDLEVHTVVVPDR